MYTLMDKFKKLCSDRHQDYPLFVDVTWGAGGTTSDLTFDLCIKAKDKYGINPNMHLTCTNMDSAKVDKALKDCFDHGITNIVALRGDPPVGQQAWSATEGGFSCALDLVRHIRELYGTHFGISVAGYPEGHPSTFTTLQGEDARASLSASELQRCQVELQADGSELVHVCRDEDFEKEIAYLKAKVDAGADFIITQMFFDAEVYGAFVRKCRESDITVPILPGIMCVTSYGGFKRMTGFCKSRVPAALLADLESVKEDDAKVRDFGVRLGVSLGRRALELGAPGLHLYTLNTSEITFGVLEGLGYVDLTAVAVVEASVVAVEQAQALALA